MEKKGILTEKQCSKIIEKYTKANDFIINEVSITPMGAQYDGLIGEQHILKIDFTLKNKKEVAQFFVKILNGGNPVMFKLSKSINAFEKEEFFYEKLVPLIKSKGFEVSFIPKSYLCEKYAVVLEDLSLLSYKCSSKNKPLDLEQCQACLETLAKFHVGPILYEIEKEKELGKSYSLVEDFADILEDKVFCEEENGATRFMRCSVKGLFQLIELIPENDISKNEFSAKLEATLLDIMSANGKPMDFRSTLLHGDLWSNNFLFKYDENNRLIDTKLVDFQTIKYGLPALDVLQFILTNTRKSFREKHQDELLQFYYKTFSDLTENRNYKVLQEKEFQESCRFLMVPAKIQAVIDRSITFMSDETFSEVEKSEDGFSRFLFEERGKFIIDSFKNNEYFREIMTEDLTELRNMLFG